MFHVYPAVVGLRAPTGIDAPCHVALYAPVLDDPGVDVLWPSFGIGQGHNEVLAIDVIEVCTVGEGTAQSLLAEGEFVVHQPFRPEGRVLRGKHVHLPDGGVAEAFACHDLQFGLPGQVEGQSALGYQFGAYVRMMVDAHPGIQRQLLPDVLSEVGIGSHLVLRLVHAGGA